MTSGFAVCTQYRFVDSAGGFCFGFEKKQDLRSIGVRFYKELIQTFPVFKMKDLTVMLKASFPLDEQRDRLCWALRHSREVLLLQGNSGFHSR